MSTNPHIVTVKAHYIDGVEMTPDVEFTCAGDSTAECHNYPDCDCEAWDDGHEDEYGEGHERKPHDECWMQDWFDNDEHCYDGEDSDDMGDYGIPRNFNRSGPIKASFEMEYISWDFTIEEVHP